MQRWARKAAEEQKKTNAALKKIHPAEVKFRDEWARYISVALTSYLPGDFPLELVANIASRLLDGENYREAAGRSLKLLRECDLQQKKLKESRYSDTAVCALLTTSANSCENDLLPLGNPCSFR